MLSQIMKSDVILYLKILQEIKIDEKVDMHKIDSIVCKDGSKDIFKVLAQSIVAAQSSLTRQQVI